MAELIRPSTVLPARRESITILTSDGLKLIGEVATPISGNRDHAILCLHPLPTHGGMMDSHLFKKAANRLPALADITVVRFNTRGTSSEQGKSEGEFGQGVAEKADVIAAINYCSEVLGIEKLWVVGWSFGTDLALQYARDPIVLGLVLLSPPLRTTTDEELAAWAQDGRPIFAFVPEYDDYLKPEAAMLRFAIAPNVRVIEGAEAKHLWVGEPSVYWILNQIVQIVNPHSKPLPVEY